MRLGPALAGAALAVGVALLASPGHAQDGPKPPKPPGGDETWDEPDKSQRPSTEAPPPSTKDQPLHEAERSLQKQYGELEQKLLRLATVIAKSQPKQAARLRRALEQSADDRINKESGAEPGLFQRVLQYLTKDRPDLDGAVVSQGELVAALERVLEVLEQEIAEETGPDSKTLQKLLDEVKELRKEEEKQRDASAKAAETDQKLQELTKAIQEIEGLIAEQKRIIGKVNDGDPSAPLAPSAQDERALAEATAAVRRALEDGAKPGEGKPTFPGEGAAPPGEGKPGEGKPGEGKPGDGQPGQGQPGQGQPGQGQPGQGQPGQGQPGQGQPGQAKQDPAKARAAKALEQAGQAMEQSSKSLDEGQRDPGLERARAAEEALEGAKAELERKKAEILRLAQQERRKAEQEATRQKTEDLAKKMGGGGEGQGQQGKPGEGPSGGEGGQKAPGARNIEKAEEAMERAGEDLANRHNADAAENQEEAAKELEAAQQTLEEALMQARKREQEAVLRALGERFLAMLARQKEITAATEKLLADSTDGRLSRPQRLAAQALGTGEDTARKSERLLARDADAALELVREEGSTSILPVVIDELVRDLDEVAALLGEGQVNKFSIALQKDIERTIEELIEVIKKEVEQRAGGGGGGGGGGDDGGNGQQLLPASAELKVIRVQQLRVNQMTEQFDLQRTAEADLSPEQQQAVRHLADKQGRVAELTRELHERLNKEK